MELVVAVSLVGLLSGLFIFPLTAWANEAASKVKESECDALNAAAAQYLVLLDKGAPHRSGFESESGALAILCGEILVKDTPIRLLPQDSFANPSESNGFIYTPSADNWRPGRFTVGSN